MTGPYVNIFFLYRA